MLKWSLLRFGRCPSFVNSSGIWWKCWGLRKRRSPITACLYVPNLEKLWPSNMSKRFDECTHYSRMLAAADASACSTPRAVASVRHDYCGGKWNQGNMFATLELRHQSLPRVLRLFPNKRMSPRPQPVTWSRNPPNLLPLSCAWWFGLFVVSVGCCDCFWRFSVTLSAIYLVFFSFVPSSTGLSLPAWM